jgi:hypothetical protein
VTELPLVPPIPLDSRLAMEVGFRENGVEDIPEGWGVRSDRRSRRNSTGTVECSGEDGGGPSGLGEGMEAPRNRRAKGLNGPQSRRFLPVFWLPTDHFRP